MLDGLFCCDSCVVFVTIGSESIFFTHERGLFIKNLHIAFAASGVYMYSLLHKMSLYLDRYSL